MYFEVLYVSSVIVRPSALMSVPEMGKLKCRASGYISSGNRLLSISMMRAAPSMPHRFASAELIGRS